MRFSWHVYFGTIWTLTYYLYHFILLPGRNGKVCVVFCRHFVHSGITLHVCRNGIEIHACLLLYPNMTYHQVSQIRIRHFPVASILHFHLHVSQNETESPFFQTEIMHLFSQIEIMNHVFQIGIEIPFSIVLEYILRAGHPNPLYLRSPIRRHLLIDRYHHLVYGLGSLFRLHLKK